MIDLTIIYDVINEVKFTFGENELDNGCLLTSPATVISILFDCGKKYTIVMPFSAGAGAENEYLFVAIDNGNTIIKFDSLNLMVIL
ncbi:unnamed protein product [Wuchereria bancrofti]|uniref:Uncharacterized protein n=1 Tax=Wuchereria bancrofti TaxID=6293 RepID=A0A3P7E322_WUCBA|nr:unnamed protein product [Wuchereria bancrofti]